MSRTDEKKRNEEIENFYKDWFINEIKSWDRNPNTLKDFLYVENKMRIDKKIHELILQIFDLRTRKCLFNRKGKTSKGKIYFNIYFDSTREELIACALDVADRFKIAEIYSYQKEIIREINFIMVSLGKPFKLLLTMTISEMMN